MEDLLKDLVKQSPNLVAVIIVVWMMLKAMSKRDRALQELHEEHIAARNESRLVIAKCTEVLGEVVISVRHMNESVTRLQLSHGKRK